MKQVYKAPYLGIIVAFLLLRVHAQPQEIRFERLTIEDGLSQSSVFTMLQDSRGFIWFGTEDGLNKYDGYKFIIFTTSKQIDAYSLSDSWVNWIAEDQDSILWIACSEGGLNRFDPEHATFRHYMHDPGDTLSLSSNRVQHIYVDKSNAIWIGTDGGGLNRYNRNNDSFTRYMPLAGASDNPEPLTILFIYQDHSGILWLGTDGNGLLAFNPADGQFKPFLLSSGNTDEKIYAITEDSLDVLWVAGDNGLYALAPDRSSYRRYSHEADHTHSLGSNQIRSLMIDNEQRLWVGTYGAGLHLFDRTSGRFLRYANDKTDPKSLSNNMVWSIIQDRSGLIWVGTNNGVNKFGRQKFKLFRNDPGNPNSLSNNFLWSLYEDPEGNVWIGTNGGGMDLFNRSTGNFRHHQHDPSDPNSLPGNRVLSIAGDHSGKIWIGTHSSGLSRYDPERGRYTNWHYEQHNMSAIPNNNVWSILEDSRGQIWIGTDGGLCRYTPAGDMFDRSGFMHNLSGQRIRALYEDNDTTLWIGTYGAGMYHYDSRMQLKNYQADPDEPGSLSDNRVSCFHRDRKGRLWIGTAKGLNLFMEEDTTFKIFMENDGLPNNVIYAIMEDAGGSLWISTNKGLSCFDPDALTFRNFNQNDGLQSNEFNSGAYCLSRTGEMLFGGVGGFNIFDPEQLKPSQFIPPVYLTGFKKFDQEQSFEYALTDLEEIVLSYKENYFSLEFAALDYTNPNKNRYAYKLDGFDQQWINSGGRRFASYTNIDGGKYTFLVRGSNSDGIWNPEPASISIIITPPFWQTAWFRILILLVLGAGLFSIYRYRVGSINRQKEKLETLVEVKTEELRESYKETDDIMDNVAEGLFLLTDELKFGKRYSRALGKILNTSDIANQDFISFLEDKIPPEALEVTREYLDLLFSKDHDFEMLNELNPLKEILFTFEPHNGGAAVQKYLNFIFRPLDDLRHGKQHLIVTVNDVTDQIRLAQQLAQAEAKTKKQMELLIGILHVDPQMLRDFMVSFEQELGTIQTLLRSSRQAGGYTGILEKIFRSMHMIKGNASLLELHLFAKMAHEFEDEISVLRDKPGLSGTDFVPLVMKLGEIRETFNEVNLLFERLSRVHQHLRPKRSYENKLLVTSLANLVNQLQAELNKMIHLNSSGFEPEHIPFNYRLAAKDILIQLIRNAAAHGIEQPEARKAAGKPPAGTITLRTVPDKDWFEFSVRDDGRGLQIDELKARARKCKKWTDAEIARWGEKETADLIFISGISTAKEVNLSSGRGVGMDLVLQKIKQYNGTIEVNFEANRFTEFRVRLPKSA